ncbi:MAG: class I SAM-dependent methyltransferase [Verrucomicrobiota bacterium]
MDPSDTLVDETFTAVTAVENQHILSQFGDVRGKRVLDYGCGSAEGGVYLAKLGAQVVGIDVSPGMLEAAKRLAAHHHVDIETRVVTSDAIPAKNDEFDLIYGNGVLHHVSLDKAIPELARVLKPGGKACFIEPLPYNPVINIYRRIAREVRTPDEKPLTFTDIERFTSHFDDVSHREFWLTTLSVFLKFYLIDRANPNKERYWKKIYTDAAKLESFFGTLRNVDDRLLGLVPPLRRMCWNTVISVASPRRG